MGGNYGRHRIADIVGATVAPMDQARVARGLVGDLKLRPVFRHQPIAPVCGIPTKGLLLAPATLIYGCPYIVISRRINHRACAGHGAHAVMELFLNSCQILEDIRMVKLQIIDHQGIGKVMHELGALIKESTIVLIGLHHKIITVCKPRRQPKILGHTANQKARSQACCIEDFRQHTAGCSFAVSARDRQNMLVTQYIFAQPLGS